MVPNDIMLSILMCESSPKRKLGYEYIIRINGKSNLKKAEEILKDNDLKKISKFVYDCKNETECQEATNELIKNNITNLDLGAYQTNYHYHPSEIKNYFNFQTSYLLACKYNHENINRYGYSWKTIARYHSGTTALNDSYKQNLIHHYSKILNNKTKEK